MKKSFFILATAMLLLGAVTTTAQVTIGSNKSPEAFSLLELISENDKGLRLPQIETDTQRDLVFTNAAGFKNNPLAIGLQIFNMESNCVEYWDGNDWISLCQGTSNPEVDIPFPACSQIRVYGKYYKNAPLNESHYIMLPMTVTKKGDYKIIATGSNGYYFQASGVFEDTGVFEIRLSGMGTPDIEQIDDIVFTCNGIQIGMLCDIKITVGALTMGYRTDCDSIKVYGIYQTRRFMDGDNIVKVPIEVLQTGITTVSTNMQNGMRFTVTQNLSTYGPDTLILKGEGSPKQEGTFTFTFTTDGSVKTTCSFEVSSFSTLGTFIDPACNCLAIYDERPLVINGEYWLNDCKDPDFPITRTYCDIAGGGWTLVWSYSENTARSVYVQSSGSGGTGNANTMAVNGAYWGVFQNRPTNRITTTAPDDGPTDYRINYNNFRLNRNEWLNLPSGERSQLKVRIADDPTDMNDEWALNNYAIITPRNAADNPILSQFDNRPGVPTVGKIYGKRWEVQSGASQGWDEMTGGGPSSRTLRLYSNATWCTHWDFYNSGSATLFQVVPDRGGAVNTMRMNAVDNSFGDFSQTEPNHHFGKCNNGSGANEDYSFATLTCAPANLVPHSFNSGQGRILQWFVK